MIADTTPDWETPTRGLLEAHTIVRPDSTLLAASNAVAVRLWVVASTIGAGDGATVIEAIGTWVTLTGVMPVTPPITALIDVPPGPTAVIVFEAPVVAVLTVAMAGLSDDHVTGRPVRRLPDASKAVAVTACVAPMLSEAERGLITTEATGTRLTVTAEVPTFPSHTAVMVAAPEAIAVTSPEPLTEATAGFEEVQVIVRPDGESGLPLPPGPEKRLATIGCVWPIASVAVAGETTTDPTGTGTIV